MSVTTMSLSSAGKSGNRQRKLACLATVRPIKRHVETVVLLSTQKAKRYVDIEITTDELDLTCAEAKATYEQIKTYIKGKYGFNVSNLYIAQVKKEFDIIERVNYNKGTEGHKVPQVTEKKRDAIIDALKHFKMI